MAAEGKFADKVAIVTGASSGIGKAAAIELSSGGALVAITGRNEEALSEVAALCGGEERCLVVAGDLTDDERMGELVAATVERFGGVDILVNSGGILKGGAVDAISMEQFDEHWNVNVRSIVLLTKLCVPHLEERKGAIVNISSVCGCASFAGAFSYCVSKAAVDQITRCAALDLAAKGIRVNAVNPGVIKTELQKRGGLSDEKYAAFLEHSKETHPLGRVGEVEEVAKLVAFLASDDASFITGDCIAIDGGRAIKGAR